MELLRESSDQVTVVLVEDHEITRHGIKAILSRDGSVDVIGEATTSDQAISVIAEKQPDVAVVDIRLESGTGLDVVRGVKEVAPTTNVLILSAYDDDRYVRALARLGVRGYMLKSVSGAELVRAIHDVAEGTLVFFSGVADAVIRVMKEEDRGKNPVPEGALTTRESEVLQYMGEGLTNREIGEFLGISTRTVEAHVHRVMLKMGTKSRVQAVLKAMHVDLAAPLAHQRVPTVAGAHTE
jgi:DNA-binding NarL/FixJ family response regulator